MKKSNFFNSMYSNVGSIKILDDIFIDPNSDYDSYYSDFDTILWLPSPDVVKQTPINQNITGIVLCVKDIEFAYEHLLDLQSYFSGGEFSGSFKKVPDEKKEITVSKVKALSESGFFLSVSLPAYLFDHDDDRKKVNAINYAITNSLLQRVFKEKHRVCIKNINVYIMGRGKINNGLDSRIAKLAKKLLNSETKASRTFVNSEKCDQSLTLDRFLGLCCWFVNQKDNRDNSKWLELIKG
ncbi:TPA: hypothetical protein RQK89_004404 [Vibrio vulnificus]|nr:hypothetical protein [Vibrio vulnificus]HDY8062456.1 hypothetical protein [Vibrio vulnificus]HDY8081512.1 hypothetical protein [Vibrio vulnificus]HDY8192431.1 hypothetical protein [Vibrio vulnificus]